MRYVLTCGICGQLGADLVRMQEHVMDQHGYSLEDLRANTHTTGSNGTHLYKMPDGVEWLKAEPVTGGQRG